MEQYNGLNESDGSAVNDNVYVDGLPPNIDNDICQQIFNIYGNIKSVKAMPGKRPGQKGAALIRWSTPEEADWVVNNLNGKAVTGLDEPVAIRFANAGGASKGGKGDKGCAGKGSYGKADGKGYPSHPGYGEFGPYETPTSPYHGGYKGGGPTGKAGQLRSAGDGVSDADMSAVVAGLYGSGQMPGGSKVPELSLYISGLPRNTTELDMFKIFSVFGALAQKGINVMMHPDGSCTGVGFVDFQDPRACQMAVATLNGSTMPDGTVMAVRPKAPRGKGK